MLKASILKAEGSIQMGRQSAHSETINAAASRLNVLVVSRIAFALGDKFECVIMAHHTDVDKLT
jgi:hypothetical protein